MTANLATVGLGLIAGERGDIEEVAHHYADLLRHRGILIWFAFVSSDRILGILGILAHAMGNLDQAAVHFEDALTFSRKAGYRPELAWTCCDYADALRVRDGEGDRAKAITLLDESLSISNELGMRPLMERVLSRRDILKA